MNSTQIVGRLTKDPELRSMPDGGSVCDMRVAYDQRNGEAGYIDVATFGKQAEACAEHLSKGRQVAVGGDLVYREWEDKEGNKRSAHSVIGRVEFLGSKPAEAPEEVPVSA